MWCWLFWTSVMLHHKLVEDWFGFVRIAMGFMRLYRSWRIALLYKAKDGWFEHGASYSDAGPFKAGTRL